MDNKPEKMDEFFNKRADVYDEHMIDELKLTEFYDEIAKIFPAASGNVNLLDLGCGTGLELERLFALIPDLSVTGIDLSKGMLDVLRAKYPGKAIDLACGSYFDIDFGENRFDYALSTYSLHHFSEEEKTGLYKRIFTALHAGGIFVEGDYTCETLEEQRRFIAENELLRKENGILSGLYHCDMPFTVGTQIRLLENAGFEKVKLVRKWDSTSIITAAKPLL